MQETKVSVRSYRACANAGVCTGGQGPIDTSSNDWCNWTGFGPEGREDHPINCIDWADSRQFCQLWFGGDLPTEAEWDKAARGEDARLYPWGNSPAPDCYHCNFDFNGDSDGEGCNSATSGPGTWPVDYLATGTGDSPYGLKDMVGNVTVWVQDWYEISFYSECANGCTDPLNTNPASGKRVQRGGSYDWGPGSLRVVARPSNGPAARYSSIGFRCRKTPL